MLTVEGDLFCGDLLENRRHPMLNSIMDDPAVARAVDAGLLASRLPRGLERSLRRAA